MAQNSKSIAALQEYINNSNNTLLNYDSIRSLVRTLVRNNIPKITISNGSWYVALCNEELVDSLKTITRTSDGIEVPTFIPAEMYDEYKCHPDEIGSIHEMRFIKADNSYVPNKPAVKIIQTLNEPAIIASGDSLVWTPLTTLN